LIRTFPPSRSEITQIEPVDTTCTDGFGTTPQIRCALETVVVVTDVAPALETVVARIDNVSVAMISGRLRKAPTVPFISIFPFAPLRDISPH
jgi:hypothetical protein